jgi:NAD-dependent SIR2 family protein deacetylase
MTCNNCESPDCRVEAAESDERVAYAWLRDKGSKAAGDRWKSASEALEQAQSDCAHRKANRTNADTLARLADIEARQDRIEAVLRAKGWM